jgi:hypothetical protein
MESQTEGLIKLANIPSIPFIEQRYFAGHLGLPDPAGHNYVIYFQKYAMQIH